MTRVTAIKQYFANSERPLANREIMDLTREDRAELGELCFDALGIPAQERETALTSAANV